MPKKPLSIVTALLVAAGLVVTATAKTAFEGLPATENEPVVVVDVSGATLLGPVHRHLAVYTSGRVAYSAFGPQTVPGVGGVQPVSRSETIDPLLVEALVSDLARAGAWQLADQTIEPTDVPLITVTVLDGQTDARAHTFSYWIPTAPFHPVDAVLTGFMKAALPGEVW